MAIRLIPAANASNVTRDVANDSGAQCRQPKCYPGSGITAAFSLSGVGAITFDRVNTLQSGLFRSILH